MTAEFERASKRQKIRPKKCPGCDIELAKATHLRNAKMIVDGEERSVSHCNACGLAANYQRKKAQEINAPLRTMVESDDGLREWLIKNLRPGVLVSDLDTALADAKARLVINVGQYTSIKIFKIF